MVGERTQTLLAVVFAVLLLPAGAVVAQTATHSATAGVTYATNSGVEVTLGDDRDVAASPFADDQTFADGNLRVSGGDASVTVTDTTYSGDPVTFESVDADPGDLTVERTDLNREITFESGDASTFQLRDYNASDGTTDLAYDSENGLTVTLGGFDGVGLVAVDAGTGDPVDSDIAGADGEATFELPAGSREIEIDLAPSELRVYDEENPDELLTDVTDLTIEFYDQSSDSPDNIEEVPVENGIADMEGLDPTVSFIAVANADGYANRRIYVDSLYETQEVYLLNESADSVAVEYELDDFSGDYPQDKTVMVVEKNIGGEWTPIQGDFFGATGKFEAQLLRDTRHRMRVVNVETGKDRVVGAFTPQTSASETVTVLPDGSISVDGGFERIVPKPAIGSISAAQGAEFGVDIQDGEQPIESWQIEIVAMNGGQETTLATRSGSGASTETFALDLREYAGATVVADVDYTTPERSGTVRLSRSVRENYAGAQGLVGGLLQIGDGLGVDDDGASSASMMASLFVSLLITAGVARVSTSADVMGITALTSVAGFAILGWVPMGVLFAATVGFGSLVVLRRGI